MKKPTQTQTQTQTQIQAQAQQAKPLEGGAAMKELQTQQQTQPNQTQQETQGGEAMIYFVTFPCKVSSQIAREVIKELRTRFPSKTPLFIPKPPPGRKTVIEIAGLPVIITFPYLKKNPNPNTQEQAKEQASQSPTQGFTLRELIKNKKT